MKKLITILLTIFCLKSYSQSIDSMVAHISTTITNTKVDSLSQTLEPYYTIDANQSGVFNIDTITLNNGDYKWFSISITAISGNNRGAGLYNVTVNNTNGVYTYSYKTISAFSGISTISITPNLLNSNRLLVITIKTGVLKPQIHYRRAEL